MQNISLLALTVIATEQVSARTFVTADGATCAPGGDAHGVAQADAKIGELFAADVLGTSVVYVSEEVAEGDRVEVGADGGVAPLNTGIPVGRALESGAAGALIEVFLFQGGSAVSAPVDNG